MNSTGRRTLWWQIAAFLPLLLMAAIVRLFAHPGVAVHWDMSGQADGWSGSLWGNYGALLTGAVILLLLLGARWGLSFLIIEKKNVLRVVVAGLAWAVALSLILPSAMLLLH